MLPQPSSHLPHCAAPHIGPLCCSKRPRHQNRYLLRSGGPPLRIGDVVANSRTASGSTAAPRPSARRRSGSTAGPARWWSPPSYRPPMVWVATRIGSTSSSPSQQRATAPTIRSGSTRSRVPVGLLGMPVTGRSGVELLRCRPARPPVRLRAGRQTSRRSARRAHRVPRHDERGVAPADAGAEEGEPPQVAKTRSTSWRRRLRPWRAGHRPRPRNGWRPAGSWSCCLARRRRRPHRPLLLLPTLDA